MAAPLDVPRALRGSREGWSEGGRAKSDGGGLSPLALDFSFGSSGSRESKTGIAGHLLGGLEFRGTAERPGGLAVPPPYPLGEPTREDGRRVAVRLPGSGLAISGTVG